MTAVPEFHTAPKRRFRGRCPDAQSTAAAFGLLVITTYEEAVQHLEGLIEPFLLATVGLVVRLRREITEQLLELLVAGQQDALVVWRARNTRRSRVSSSSSARSVAATSGRTIA